uniref:Protein kinase domain-containing protein n=1 Tax=Panagrolaimus superbus TaxID=310955 RepID=A0A914Z7N1_9BILA
MGCINSRCDVEADGRKFCILKEIAQGGFSVIYLAKDNDSGEKCVIKKVDCNSMEETERTRREVNIHQKFGSTKNIIQIFGASEVNGIDGGIRFFLIFPYRNLGSLQSELERRASSNEYIDLPKLINFFSQICQAVRTLHHNKPPLIHRDLKPANILFADKDNLELTDFGSCVFGPISIKDGKHSRYLIDDAGENSTMTYRAPELFNCETGTVLDQSIDIWSLGCLLYAMCFFKSPFDEIYEKGDSVPLAMMSGRIKFPKNSPFPNSLLDLITKLITVDPIERPKIDDVIRLIKSLILS